MKWRLIRGSDVEQLKNMGNEWERVSLYARIIRNHPSVFSRASGSGDKTWVQYMKRRILGAMFVSGDGVVLPAFTFLDTRDEEFLFRLLLLSPQPLFSIMGSASNVLSLERILHEHNFDSQNYHMLTLSIQHFVGERFVGMISEPPPRQADAKDYNKTASGSIPEATRNFPLSIHRAIPRDIHSLWPLEYEYTLEEVLRPGMKLNETKAKKHFQRSLEREIIHYARIGNEVVAKAGTSAGSWNYDQLGGVYVKPTLRRRGIARQLMESLIRDPRRNGRSCCLFVKPDNYAALKLYEKLQFIRRGLFRISYINPPYKERQK